MNRTKGKWRVDGNAEAFWCDLFACADLDGEIADIARKHMFVDLGVTEDLPLALMEVWLAGQFRYWQGKAVTTEDYDFAPRLKGRFADCFAAGRVNVKEVQALCYVRSLAEFGFGQNAWLDAEPRVQQTYRLKMENLANDLKRQHSDLYDYVKWLKEAAEAQQAASLTLACLLSPPMLERFLQETAGQRTAVKAREERRAHLERWSPVATAQLSHLEAHVQVDDEALSGLRSFWDRGYKDPQNLVSELAVIAARHGVALLTDAELKTLRES